MYNMVFRLSKQGLLKRKNIMSIKITESELLNELKRIKTFINKTPQTEDIKKLSVYSINAYKRAFGGINNALIKIGEKPILMYGFTKQEVIAEILRISLKLNKTPNVFEFSAEAKMSYNTARKVFDNLKWGEILNIANREEKNKEDDNNA